MSWREVYDKIRRYFNPYWDFSQAQSLLAFRQFLGAAQNPAIRMWADATPGIGHQASTVAILRQLAAPADGASQGFGYAGQIQVYYAPGPENDATLQKLFALLPEMEDDVNGEVGGAQVELIAWQGQAVNPQVALGFTGGADESVNLADRLNTGHFLRLQPYRWGAPEQVQFHGDRPAITLTEQRSLGYGSFKQRAYFMPSPVPEPNWDIYAGTDWADKAAIISLLTTGEHNFGICPVYGIRSENESMQLAKPASDRMFEVITSVLASQNLPDGGGTAPGARPIVVLSCDRFFAHREQDRLPALISGERAQGEVLAETQLDMGVTDEGRPLTGREIAQYRDFLLGRGPRATWLEAVEAASRVRYLWNPLVGAVGAELEWLTMHNDQVLFIQLGQVPAPLYAWCMQQAAWSPVFEGQSSASIALNVGEPYFHVARLSNTGIQYPTNVVGYNEYELVTAGSFLAPLLNYAPRVPRRIQSAANWLNHPISDWNPVAAQNPAESTASLVREYRAEGGGGPLHAYFRSVRDFYRNANNDKLRVGTAFFQYVLDGARQAAERLASGAASALQELLTELKANLSADGTLSVAPGALNSGGIYDFYAGYLGADPGLVLTGASLDTESAGPDLVAIIATGSTSFFGVPLAARITFTAPEGVVVADGRYVYDQRWTLDEIPWIGLSAPFLEIYTADSAAPPAASVGGTLEGAQAEVAFRLPVAEGKWQLVGAFPPPYPGIGRFYQLAGGIDLVRSLPAPFDGLAGFGLQNAQLVYDEVSGQVEYIGFRMATSAAFTLTGTVRVENVTAEVTVQNPADLGARQTDWTVRGTFTLGTKSDAGTVMLAATGPQLALTGDLISGVLRISDVIEAFAPSVRLDLPPALAVTGFQCSFAPDTGDYGVGCALNIDWPVYAGGSGTPVFSIESVQFAASRLAGMVAGQLTGYVVIDPDGAGVPLELTASYAPESGWIFLAIQPPDAVFSLSALANQFLPPSWQIGAEYGIAGLSLTAAVDEGSWRFTGRTAQPWTVPFISGLEVSASLALGYDAPAAGGAEGGWFGRLETDWTWQGIAIKIFFDYAPDKESYGIVWGALAGEVEGPDEDGDWVATLTFTEDTTVGQMVETMVSWATGSRFALEAPWSVLNAIPLGGPALAYTFNSEEPARDTVAFGIDIGPVDLGFARIDTIGVVYNAQAARRVAVTLGGSFPWNAGADAEGDTTSLGPWDASSPGTAPAPPGTGNKYVDLRLLAMGQHVTVAGLTAADTVQRAIELMATLTDPEPGRIPEVAFDPASAWIIGADLGILRFGDGDGESGYLVTTQVVFNDPHLYGLRLALAGDAAKVFKGLDFQIMYRQVSDTVGVYQGEITLPDAMRRLSIGAYTITLPVFAVAVYTNGDFQVDLGFPWNADFSRSFTVEAVVFPGVPVVGSAGCYFGRLSSATTGLAPQALNGTFSPVLVFGFGMQLGFGKSIEYGALRAGFSVTAAGIMEGVLAPFNPYLPASTATGSPAQLQDSYYFWLRGTFGIAGRLYGSVDFSVIKAEVNVSLSLLLQVTCESYVSVSVTVIVSVDVSVSIRIDLGLFTIRLSFSFSMRLEETFTIENPGSAPWITAGPAGGAHSLSGPADRRQVHRRAPRTGLAATAAAADRWARLQPSSGGVKPLTAWLAPGLTVAHDEWDQSGSYVKQVPCYVFLPLIETVPETEGTVAQVVAQTAAAAADTSFELLAKMVLRWVVAAGQTADLTPEQVDQLVVSEADLTYLLDAVLVSTDSEPVPIAPQDVDTFLGRQFLMTMDVPSGAAGESSATAFPMPPALRINALKYGADYAGCDYTLADYNAVDDATLISLRAYFDQLAVQVADTPAGPGPPRSAGGPLSMAQWVQSDYFLLLARQMTQAALDSLRDFKYVAGTDTPQGIADHVNAAGQLAGGDRLTVAGLFAANPGHPLTIGSQMTVGATVAVAADDSFETVSAGQLQSAVTPTALAMANAGNSTLLRAGAVIVYQGSRYVAAAGDTLITVARHFGARFADLLSGAPELMTDRALFTAGSRLLTPLITCRAKADSSFATLAAQPAYASKGIAGLTGTELAQQNAARPVLRIGEMIGYGNQPPYTMRPNDCLADVAMHFNVSLADLLAKSTVVSQPRLLADVAVLDLPPFGYKAGENDTLAAVASRMATTVEILAMAPANGSIAGLFADADAAGAATPWIDVPHLAQYQVGEIIAEIQRTLGIRQLSRMAARYTLHGTRLPTAGITPKAKGMWVTGSSPNLALPPMAGLYALTGQQIQVPQVQAASGELNVTILKLAGPSWLVYPGGASKLPIVVQPNSPDALRIAQVTRAATYAPFDIGLASLGAGPMCERRLASYPLTTVAEWQSPAVVTLPYGPPPKADQVQTLRIWTLPYALTDLPDPRTPGKIAPRFAVRLATYDEATGGTVASEIESHGWATVVEFTVKRIPPILTSPTTADTYEIAGAGGAGVVLLERIVDEIGTDDGAFDQLLLAYPPDATSAAGSGLQTDAQATVTFGISQVNLSTETRPPAAGAASTRATAGGALLLNTPSSFIRLLWEASITRAGGFYLYYHDDAGSRGLPERIFNDRGEARVSLIVVYAAGQALPDADRVRDYLTAVVTATSIDTSQAVVFAEAAPMEPPVQAAPGLSLALLAERTYSDIADLAAGNSGLKLAAGVRLQVSGAVYQAPPGGAALASVEAAFGVSAAALNEANPRWTGGLPDPLPPLTAIYLPKMTITAGTSPHTASLADVAGYYGVELAALASRNAAVSGIFTEGQQITIPGGPALRTATVVPGSAAVTASRAKPADVPIEPDAESAQLLLANTFSMLGYRVAGNVYFSASNAGLPAGPVPPAADVQPALDKVRVAPASETWEYRQSLPYPRFAIAPAPGAGNLPPASGDPYRGLGSIFQVDYSWQDYYGNTLVTTLTSPPAQAQPPFNKPPMVTGYTDPLIALSQWPSVSSAWRVSGGAGQATLDLVLTFDPSRYQGLIRATAAGPGEIWAQFTDPLDEASANTAGNYSLDGGIAIASAVRSADGLGVTLTTDRPLTAGRVYVLTVSNVQAQATATAAATAATTGAAQQSYSGSSTFPYPDGPGEHSSSLAERAARDLNVYTALYYQLTDAYGVAATVTTSLLGQPVDLDGSQWAAMMGWLFTGSASVYAFICDRAAGATTVPAPPAQHTIFIKLSAERLNPNQIYELSVVLRLGRTGGAVLGELETTAGIRSADTTIAPLAQPLGAQDTLGLETFARAFEAALSVPGSHVLKVAGGVNRATASAARDGAALWAVRIGTGAGQAISYTVANPGNPDLFAPRPISNQLQSRQAVPIYDYDLHAGGISPTPTRKLDFADVDMDVWGRALLAAVDGTLTPEFVSALRIVMARAAGAADYLQQILDQKKLIATAVSGWMIPLYAGESADPGPVREVFYQQLLSRLSNAYDTRAGIQFRADVKADIQDPLATMAPRLFGGVLDKRSAGEERSEITLTSPKLPLQTAAGAPLPFLLAAPETVNRDGVVVGSLELDLAWEAASIEHQIAQPQGITGYLASSWLSFVVPDESGGPAALTRPLGAFPVPLVLRSFPVAPSMTGHTGTADHPGSPDLAALAQWTYTFSWSLPFHYVQDRVHGRVEFNLSGTAASTEADVLFPALAEFVTVYPHVRADLETILAGIDATTQDARRIQDAAVAAGAFVELLRRVTSALGGSGLAIESRPATAAGQADLTYAFEVTEGSADLPDPADPGGTVRALLVTITGTVPAGVGTPAVLVDPEHYDPVPHAPAGAGRAAARGGAAAEPSFGYCYADRATGRYLLQADGQKIPERTVSLTGLDVFQRQDAWSSARITRNEQILPGLPPMAEPFVYTTPEVRFADPLLPTLHSTAPIDIARLGQGGPQRPLDEQFKALFGELFADLPADAGQLTIQVETAYHYRLAPVLDPIELPVFFQAPASVVVRGNAPGTTLAAMIDAWTRAIRSWFTAAPPSAAEGALHLDLAILSNLTAHPMPLLRLRNLTLALIDIVPPLPTA